MSRTFDRKRSLPRAVAVAAGVALTAALPLLYLACVPNPDIDGAKVPPIGSDADVPACPPLCERLAALCGYPPVDCEKRCEEELGEEQRVCIGQAPSCRAALQDCTPPEGEEEDAGDDAEPEPEEDAGDDAEVETDAEADAAEADAETDAPADAPDDGG